MILSAAANLLFPALLAAAAPPPTISVNGGTFIGKETRGIHQFLGIPFAQPPVGDLRLRLPVPIVAYNGTYNATKFGRTCPQQSFNSPVSTVEGLDAAAGGFFKNSVFGQVTDNLSEDCLMINVFKPASANSTSKLPVLVWIYGGGFNIGGTSMYDGNLIVGRSKQQGKPLLFVSMNYRLNGFGFMASKEIREAGVGNLGLHDQREALRWVQKHISDFGGDPAKVTIWGASAGAISVAMQMIAYDGNHDNLFRGAIMHSGAPIPVGPIENGQIYYDNVVKLTGCSGASDTLQCLRGVPYEQLKAAIDQSPTGFTYQSLRLAWIPREDGIFFTDEPYKLVQQGKVANVPYITGNCDDEGTIFSRSTLNATTSAQWKSWLKYVFFPGITDSQVDKLGQLYPSDITKGSPFATGIFNAVTPQFKRFAAFQGDGVFQAPRRWFLQHTAHKQDAYVYLSKRFKFLPIFGSAHGTDVISSFFLGLDAGEHVIRFAHKLDPNGGNLLKWPKYNNQTKQILVYLDNILFQPHVLDADTYRKEQMEYMNQFVLETPI